MKTQSYNKFISEEISFFQAFIQRFAANLKEIPVLKHIILINYSVTEPINFYTADHFHSL